MAALLLAERSLRLSKCLETYRATMPPPRSPAQASNVLYSLKHAQLPHQPPQAQTFRHHRLRCLRLETNLKCSCFQRTVFQRRLYLQRILQIRFQQQSIDERENFLQGDIGRPQTA